MENGQFIIRQASRKMGPFLPDAAADIAGATAFGRASVIPISRSVSRRCASGGLCARLYARAAIRGRLAPPREGAPARPRTRRSRWRPCLGPRVRAARAGSPLAGRGCSHTSGVRRRNARGQKTDGGAYKRRGMRIARSDGGTRPSSRFPNSALQRNGSCASLLRRSSKTRGRAAVGAHSVVSAVSAEIVGGTLPEKRFSRRSLRRTVPVQHARVDRETARAAARRTARPAW